MRIKAGAMTPLIITAAAVTFSTSSVAQTDDQTAQVVGAVEQAAAESAENLGQVAEETTESAAESVEEAPKSFEDALDEIEKNKGSLVSEDSDAPYLFEYEYEYEYDSSYSTGFKPKSESGADVAGTAGQEAGGDRIEQAGQQLVDASLLAPKSRVRQQFVKLGGESISTIGLQSLNDLVATGVRGLFIQPNEFSSSTLDLTLRGVSGTTVDQVTGESGVGVFVDGVPVLRGQAYGLGLIDLESIDMLRGSRGVVSGRNAAGGAMYLNSRKPDGEFGLRQRLRLGFAFDDVQSITNIDLPTVTGLPMTRVSYLTTQHDGWVESVAGPASSDFPQRKNTAWRIAMSSVPSDRLSIDFAVERSDLESTPHYFQPVTQRRIEGTGVALVIPESKTDQTAATFNASLVVGEDYELKTILGWNELQDTSFVNYGDQLGPLVQGFNSLEGFDNQVLYGELQLNGKLFDDKVNFSAGFAITEDDSEYDGLLAIGEADLRSTSVYLQAVVSVIENLSLTVGYRSTEDEKDFSRTAYLADPDIGNNLAAINAQLVQVLPGRSLTSLSDAEFQTLTDPAIDPFGPGTPPGPFDGAIAATINNIAGYDFDDRTAFLEDSVDDFAVALDYDISKQLSGYVSWSTGYKAGGASLLADWEGDEDSIIYRPEKTETIQLGIKGNLLDSKLYFDAAIFSNDIDDRQLVLANPSNRRLTNIINAQETTTISGAELDLRYSVSEAIRLSAFVTVLDADDTATQPVYRRTVDGDAFYQFNPTNPENVLPPTAFVERAPDTSIAITADFKFGLGQSKDSVFRLEYINNSGYYYDTFTSYDESRSLLNARLLFSGFELEGADDGKIEISIWGENLLDEDYVVNALEVDSDPIGASSPSTFAAFGEPLTYGIDVDFVF